MLQQLRHQHRVAEQRHAKAGIKDAGRPHPGVGKAIPKLVARGSEDDGKADRKPLGKPAGQRPRIEQAKASPLAGLGQERPEKGSHDREQQPLQVDKRQKTRGQTKS